MIRLLPAFAVTLAISPPLGAQEQAAQRSPLVSIDEYVAKAMADWQVPGLAIAIVKDDQVVYERGYGLVKAGEEQPVTAETLFPIASCTKSFTAAGIGLLVDEEQIVWNDHVRKHVPGFELYDPFVTREATLVVLLAHRTGLQPGDKLWSKNEFAPDEIVRRMRFLRSKYSFRSRFSYNNLAYLVAGQVVERISGRSWGDFVEERILQPAGMRSTTTTFPGSSGFA
jgi:CubicO group peptidase (beta-lactamase class C family)